jgi:predicted DnaQ family exonuclease/DinG family helicase
MEATAGREYVVFDLEATGLSAKTDQILEVGAIRYDAELRRLDALQLLVDPGIPIPVAVQRLVGITTADLVGAPSPTEAVAQLADFCRGAILVTHGGAFDMHFVRALAPDAFRNRLMYDTLELARILLPMAETHALQTLARMLGLPHEQPHRALSDATATGALFGWLRNRAAELPDAVLRDVRRVAATAGAPLHGFFGEVRAPARAPAEASAQVPAANEQQSAPAATATAGSGRSPTPVADDAAAPDVPADLARVALEEAVVTALSPGGPLDTGAFEYREAQLQMARAVAQTLERGRRAAVEAGTGVGKSLAYLVPLALWTARTGERAVVATHTVNLQEQLADRDLPRIAALTDPPPRTAVLKGRNHYISLRRWARFLAQPDAGTHGVDLDAVRFKLKILVWLSETKTGDRSELHLTGEEEALWLRIASDREDCLGTVCLNWQTRRCHMVAARQRATDASLVITNHSLLLADSERQGQVLAPYRALVIDEAHQLEASATAQLGTTVKAFDVALILERVPARSGTEIAAAVGRCREAMQRLLGDAKGFVAGWLGLDHPSNARLGLREEVRSNPRFQPVERSARVAAGALLQLASMLDDADADALEPELLPGVESAQDEAEAQAYALRALSHDVERILLAPRDGTVTWLELRAEQAELHEAPISVAEPLRRRIYDRCDATVLTSATLTIAGSFDFIRARTGLGEGAEELALPSPFDYLGSALTVLAGGVPPYDDPEHESVVADLVAALAYDLDGHTLVLFTGYNALRSVHGLVRDRLERRRIALLGQGIDGTRRQILRSFLQDPRAVLLGTSSFWEGVDIPGERLCCVVIDKLPFPVPTDPLVRARSEGLRDPFAQYSLPVATLRLRQGFGRLIRGESDRGAVVLCDERLDSRDYGEVFLRSLPPAEQTRCNVLDVPERVRAFVRSNAAGASR